MPVGSVWTCSDISVQSVTGTTLLSIKKDSLFWGLCVCTSPLALVWMHECVSKSVWEQESGGSRMPHRATGRSILSPTRESPLCGTSCNRLGLTTITYKQNKTNEINLKCLVTLCLTHIFTWPTTRCSGFLESTAWIWVWPILCPAMITPFTVTVAIWLLDTSHNTEPLPPSTWKYRIYHNK